MKRFYWNEETLLEFRFESSYLPELELKESVKEFVANCCDLEDNETEEDLVEDLMRQIYEVKSNKK